MTVSQINYVQSVHEISSTIYSTYELKANVEINYIDIQSFVAVCKKKSLAQMFRFRG